MRKLLTVIIAIFLTAIGSVSDETNLLEAGASVEPRRLARGEEGKLILKFTIREGITINSQPVFKIELDPSEELTFPKDFFTASDLEIKIVEEDGKEFLDLSQPVAIPFIVRQDAQRGNHILKGKVLYFARSMEGEWCLKDKTTFSASFYTSNRIIR